MYPANRVHAGLTRLSIDGFPWSSLDMVSQSRCCGCTGTRQISWIPPYRARIEAPSATMLSAKPVVNDIRYKEWDTREVVVAAFKGPVCSTKHEGGDSMLSA